MAVWGHSPLTRRSRCSKRSMRRTEDGGRRTENHRPRTPMGTGRSTTPVARCTKRTKRTRCTIYTPVASRFICSIRSICSRVTNCESRVIGRRDKIPFPQADLATCPTGATFMGTGRGRWRYPPVYICLLCLVCLECCDRGIQAGGDPLLQAASSASTAPSAPFRGRQGRRGHLQGAPGAPDIPMLQAAPNARNAQDAPSFNNKSERRTQVVGRQIC